MKAKKTCSSTPTSGSFYYHELLAALMRSNIGSGEEMAIVNDIANLLERKPASLGTLWRDTPKHLKAYAPVICAFKCAIPKTIEETISSIIALPKELERVAASVN